MDAENIEIPALGLPLHPGTLYDCLNVRFLPGVFLWDEDAINKAVKVMPQTHTRNDFAMSDSLSEKTKLMDISASVKASFMAGLLEVGGSASYLKDTSTSMRQCRATVKYRQTTQYKQLNVTQLGKVTHRKVLNKHTATHVVIGTLYGAEAYMVFDQMASNEEDKQVIRANMEASVTKLPNVGVSASAGMEMSDEEKKKVEKFSCTFHGDFALEKNPSTYEEAMLVYKQLPELVGNGSNAVPLNVWLYPLNKLHPKAAKVLPAIGVKLVTDMEDLMGQLLEANMRANDAIGRGQAIKVTDITDKLVKMQKNLVDYTETLKQNLSKALSAIRAGTEGEEKLLDILKFHDESSFTHDQMRKWLDDKESEIGVLESYITSLEGCLVVPPGPELNKVLTDPEQKYVVVFTFTSLKKEEPYLSNLDACLADGEFRKMQEISAAQRLSFKEETLPWFRDPDISQKMREVQKIFAKQKFTKKPIISYIPDAIHLGASIYVYRGGKLENRDWQL